MTSRAWILVAAVMLAASALVLAALLTADRVPRRWFPRASDAQLPRSYRTPVWITIPLSLSQLSYVLLGPERPLPALLANVATSGLMVATLTAFAAGKLKGPS